jgi:hypothetical protein
MSKVALTGVSNEERLLETCTELLLKSVRNLDRLLDGVLFPGESSSTAAGSSVRYESDKVGVEASVIRRVAFLLPACRSLCSLLGVLGGDSGAGGAVIAFDGFGPGVSWPLLSSFLWFLIHFVLEMSSRATGMTGMSG